MKFLMVLLLSLLAAISVVHSFVDDAVSEDAVEREVSEALDNEEDDDVQEGDDIGERELSDIEANDEMSDDEEAEMVARKVEEGDSAIADTGEAFDGVEETPNLELGKRLWSSCSKTTCVWRRCCSGRYCSNVKWCRKCGRRNDKCGVLGLFKRCCPGLYCRGLVKKCQRCRKRGERCGGHSLGLRPPCCRGLRCKGFFKRRCK